MDFEFSDTHKAFAAEVEAFLDANDDPDVFDLTRENMAQLVDTPKRRAFMKEMGHKGWLGITWPAEYGGSEGEGVYEYLLNEALAARGGPQIGKGVGIVGKTIIAHGSERLKAEFLPMILENDVEFAVGYSEPDAGSDAASMRLKAERHTAEDGTEGWLLNGQKIWTTSAHFAEWYWLGTRTDPDNKHLGITLMLVPLHQPRHHYRRHLDHGRRAHQLGVPRRRVRARRLRRGARSTTDSRYISQALDLERFTMFTFSPIKQRLDLLTEWVNTAERDGEAVRDDPRVRARLANLHTEAEVARVLGLKFVAEAVKVEQAVREGKEGFQPPTVAASEYKLYATELSKRLADASMDIAGPGSQLRGPHRRRPDEGPGRLHVPLHRDRHHRGRRLGDPEEHHRPPGPRPPQELLTVCVPMATEPRTLRHHPA